MIPQDKRAPQIQSRWIELENVGSVEIPPRGVCEVVDSYRPESGSAQTPDGGVTVLKVRRPTKDNPCNHVVNGPCAIPVGKRGKPGTKDSPMLALCTSEASPEDQVGVKKDSFELQLSYCGYVVDGDVADGLARVTRYDNCPNEKFVRAYDCLLPGEGGYAIPMVWDDYGQEYVDEEGADMIQVCDPLCWLLSVPGDKPFKVTRKNCSDDCWTPAFPFGLTRQVLIKNPIECWEEGVAEVMLKDPELCVWDPPEGPCEIPVCNNTGRKIACDAEERATVQFHPGECKGWLIPRERARYAKAILAGDLCDAEASITGIEYLDVCDWDPRQEPTSAKNPSGRKACAGRAVLLTWNDQECGWDIIAVQPTDIGKVMKNVMCGTECTVDRLVTKGNVWAEVCEDCGEDIQIPSDMVGTRVNIREVSLNCTDNRLNGFKRSICVFCEVGDLEEDNHIEFEEIEVPVGSPYAEEVLDGYDVVGCNLIQPTAKYWVLGCADGQGGDITTPMTDLPYLTNIFMGLSQYDGLCVTAYKEKQYVLGGCWHDEGEVVRCIPVDPCPPEEE